MNTSENEVKSWSDIIPKSVTAVISARLNVDTVPKSFAKLVGAITFQNAYLPLPFAAAAHEIAALMSGIQHAC